MAPRDMRRRPRAAADEPLVLRLGYRPPYDFEAILAFLSTRALPGIEQVDRHSYARVFGPPETPGWLRLTAWPKDEHALRLELHCPESTLMLDVVMRLRRMFDLDADPVAIHAALGRDRKLGPLLRKRPGLRLPGGWDGFEIAVRAILGQQISVAAARTLAMRIVQRYGAALETPTLPGLDRLFPLPATLVDADLRTLGLTTARAATVQSMARAVIEERADFRAERTLDDFVARWVTLPGIGEWTAHYMAMRTLSHPDAFPAADLILRRAAADDDTPLSTKALTVRAEAWRPWRAYAVMHLWHSTIREPADA
jgi:AraC family transcriptional regulator of adaptative response / DNA-3-methyladenine glycosylase II